MMLLVQQQHIRNGSANDQRQNMSMRTSWAWVVFELISIILIKVPTLPKSSDFDSVANTENIPQVAILQKHIREICSIKCPYSGETGWVVIDICQRDVHGGGPRQASHLATHVLGLNHHLVLFSVLSIHVEQRCLDDTYGCEIEIQKWKGRHERYFMESFIYANKCRLSPTICKPLCRCHCDIKMIICSLPSEGNYSHTGERHSLKSL